MRTVLTIAGFDPSSGAGITADLMVFAAHGLFGTSCITALTVQSTRGVFSTHPIAPAILEDTLQHLTEDLPPAGIKIGMLATTAAVISIASYLTRLRASGPRIPVVLDPVLRSTSGRELLEPAALTPLLHQILPLVDWITPNLAELAILTGLSVDTREHLPPAALALQKLGGPHLNVLATGGHLIPPDDLLLAANAAPIWLPGEHIPSASTHGTGCALSSALLSRLVLGDAPYPAALAAKHYVAQAIRAATPIGSGKGPLNLLWPLS